MRSQVALQVGLSCQCQFLKVDREYQRLLHSYEWPLNCLHQNIKSYYTKNGAENGHIHNPLSEILQGREFPVYPCGRCNVTFLKSKLPATGRPVVDRTITTLPDSEEPEVGHNA